MRKGKSTIFFMCLHHAPVSVRDHIVKIGVNQQARTYFEDAVFIPRESLYVPVFEDAFHIQLPWSPIRVTWSGRCVQRLCGVIIILLRRPVYWRMG